MLRMEGLPRCARHSRHGRPAEISRARDAAERFIREQTGPADLLCIGSVSAKTGARFMPGFTRSRKELEKGLDSLVVPNEMQGRTVTISETDEVEAGRDKFT